jgi:hypothetical protein
MHVSKVEFFWLGASFIVALIVVSIALIRTATSIALAILGGVAGASIGLFNTSNPFDATLAAAGASLLGVLLGGNVGLAVHPPALHGRAFRRAAVVLSLAAVPVSLFLMFLLRDVFCPLRFPSGRRHFCDHCIDEKGGGWPMYLAIIFFVDLVVVVIHLLACARIADESDEPVRVAMLNRPRNG